MQFFIFYIPIILSSSVIPKIRISLCFLLSLTDNICLRIFSVRRNRTARTFADGKRDSSAATRTNEDESAGNLSIFQIKMHIQLLHCLPIMAGIMPLMKIWKQTQGNREIFIKSAFLIETKNCFQIAGNRFTISLTIFQNGSQSGFSVLAIIVISLPDNAEFAAIRIEHHSEKFVFPETAARQKAICARSIVSLRKSLYHKYPSTK